MCSLSFAIPSSDVSSWPPTTTTNRRFSSSLVLVPMPSAGDWFYQATEVSALVMVLGLLACVTMIYNASYGRGADKFGAPGACLRCCCACHGHESSASYHTVHCALP